MVDETTIAQFNGTVSGPRRPTVDETTTEKFRRVNDLVTEPPKRTLAVLAQEAIDIQNACNIRGLSKSFAKVCDEVCDLNVAEGNYGNVRNHPIVQLWASKLHDLAGMGLSDFDEFGKAYNACKKLAKPESNVVIPGVCPGHLDKLRGKNVVLAVADAKGWTTLSGPNIPSVRAALEQAKRLFGSCETQVQCRIAGLEAFNETFAYFDMKRGEIAASTYIKGVVR